MNGGTVVLIILATILFAVIVLYVLFQVGCIMPGLGCLLYAGVQKHCFPPHIGEREERDAVFLAC
jgi:hypothetical protein